MHPQKMTETKKSGKPLLFILPHPHLDKSICHSSSGRIDRWIDGRMMVNLHCFSGQERDLCIITLVYNSSFVFFSKSCGQCKVFLIIWISTWYYFWVQIKVRNHGVLLSYSVSFQPYTERRVSIFLQEGCMSSTLAYLQLPLRSYARYPWIFSFIQT